MKGTFLKITKFQLQSLASQSSFFDRLFNGDFKEKDMAEIPLGDVQAEVFLST